MSSIKLYNDLNDQFIKIHRITYLLNKRDLECMNVLENWIESTVTILKDNNLNESELISQFRGQLVIERLRTDKKIPKRKKEFNAVTKIINPLKQAWNAGEIEILIDSCNGEILKPIKPKAWKFWERNQFSSLLQ